MTGRTTDQWETSEETGDEEFLRLASEPADEPLYTVMVLKPKIAERKRVPSGGSWYSQLERSYGQPRGQVTSWPSGTYRTIYIDPPWPFVDRVNPRTRGAVNYYECLSVKQIANLDVASLAAEDCLLWMWVPRLFRRFGEEVIESWGFIPKTEWIWVKTTVDGTRIRGGMGHNNRMAHEYLMLGTRGLAKPLNGRREVSVICAPRGEHSRKPDVFYELVERNTLEPRIELFARGKRKNWSTWGDEASPWQE